MNPPQIDIPYEVNYSLKEMRKSTIRDKTGYEWIVGIDEQFGDKVLPLTLANFYVFRRAKLPGTFRHPIGRGHISIKDRNTTVAKIEDLEVDSDLENRGIGSSLLKFMENWAREHGVKKLIGDLSSVDAEHIDKLSYFYRKYGYKFQLHDAEEKTSSTFIGKVEKILI